MEDDKTKVPDALSEQFKDLACALGRIQKIPTGIPVVCAATGDGSVLDEVRRKHIRELAIISEKRNQRRNRWRRRYEDAESARRILVEKFEQTVELLHKARSVPMDERIESISAAARREIMDLRQRVFALQRNEWRAVEAQRRAYESILARRIQRLVRAKRLVAILASIVVAQTIAYWVTR